MANADTSSFSGLRSYLWPIHAHEAKKLIPMAIMIAFVALDYSILRNLKDTLLITEPGSGAEVLPFIKVWVMLPAAIVSTILLSYLLNHFSKTVVFTSITLFFFIFFICFGFFIYPNRSFLHPHTSANYLESLLPLGFKGLIAMYRNWTVTCFYVIAELWGTIVLQVLMWGFVNEITKVSEAPRFYGVLVIACNVAAICAGQIANALKPATITSPDVWNQTLIRLLLLIVGLGCVSLTAFLWMAKHVFSNPDHTPHESGYAKKKQKKKLTFKESLYHIANSKYLLCIAGIVISYNLVINLVEVIWKDRLHRYCPNPGDFNTYINNLTTTMGIISTTAAVLMVGIIQRLGWTKTALLTPGVLLITTSAFFICLFGGEAVLGLAVFFGSLQNCCTKAAKYSVFDATKEMAFVPLDPDHKMKGKAAIDGIGSRIAKSGGSIIQQGLLLFCGTLVASAPYVALIVAAVTSLWLVSILTLGKEYGKLAQEVEEEVLTTA